MKARLTAKFAESHKRYREANCELHLTGTQASEVNLRTPQNLGSLADEVRLGRIEVALDDVNFLGAQDFEKVGQYVKDLVNTGKAVAPAVIATPVSRIEVVPAPQAIEEKAEDEWKNDGPVTRQDYERMSMKQVRKISKKMGLNSNALFSKEKLIDGIMGVISGKTE